MTDFRMARELVEHKRDEDHRALQLKIIADAVDGKVIDPAAYRATPEGYAFALQMREVSRVDESQSAATAATIRNEILTQSSTEGGLGLKAYTDLIAASPKMNPKERQRLLTELPTLIEGRNLMADEMVRQPITDRLPWPHSGERAAGRYHGVSTFAGQAT